MPLTPEQLDELRKRIESFEQQIEAFDPVIADVVRRELAARGAE